MVLIFNHFLIKYLVKVIESIFKKSFSLQLFKLFSIKDQCAFVNETFSKDNINDIEQFDLKAETLIYSNYEQTLSFLIQISFKSIRKISKIIFFISFNLSV